MLCLHSMKKEILVDITIMMMKGTIIFTKITHYIITQMRILHPTYTLTLMKSLWNGQIMMINLILTGKQ